MLFRPKAGAYTRFVLRAGALCRLGATGNIYPPWKAGRDALSIQSRVKARFVDQSVKVYARATLRAHFVGAESTSSQSGYWEERKPGAVGGVMDGME